MSDIVVVFFFCLSLKYPQITLFLAGVFGIAAGGALISSPLHPWKRASVSDSVASTSFIFFYHLVFNFSFISLPVDGSIIGPYRSPAFVHGDLTGALYLEHVPQKYQVSRV